VGIAGRGVEDLRHPLLLGRRSQFGPDGRVRIEVGVKVQVQVQVKVQVKVKVRT